jgi:hypothetical protein
MHQLHRKLRPLRLELCGLKKLGELLLADADRSSAIAKAMAGEFSIRDERVDLGPADAEPIHQVFD